MYMNATSKDLRYKTKAILKAVAAGKRVVITNRGKPKAVIHSINSSADISDQAASNDVAGMWADHQDIKDIAGHVRKLRRARVTR